MANTSAHRAQSMPPQVLIVFGIIIIVAAIFGGYFVLYEPAIGKLEQAQRLLAQKNGELEDLQTQESEYFEFKKENERLEARLGVLQAKIPSTTDELNIFLGSINQRARTSSVDKWTLFKQENNISKGEFDAIPIRMEFEATYEATLRFFWELADMGGGLKVSNREPLINIHDVNIERKSPKKDSSTTMLNVSCVAETYLYTGNTSAPKAKGKK
jgi:Tfp pilus assembly protein PilO